MTSQMTANFLKREEVVIVLYRRIVLIFSVSMNMLSIGLQMSNPKLLY